jgi:hypothetical protein
MAVLKGSLPDFSGAAEEDGPEPKFKAAIDEAAVEPKLPSTK